MAHILIVEDERNVALTIKNELCSDGHTVEIVRDGDTALLRATVGHFDLLLLDVGLPKKDGNAVCRELRHLGNRIPIIMLTAREREADKVVGLNIGADDYIVKPWHTLELLARVRALMRRTAVEEPEIYHFGNVKFDVTKGEVVVGNKLEVLTPIEFRLLCIFVRRPGRVQSRDHLHAEIRSNSPEAVDNHVMYLRRKIEPNSKRPTYIVTVPGIGYRFDGSS